MNKRIVVLLKTIFAILKSCSVCSDDSDLKEGLNSQNTLIIHKCIHSILPNILMNPVVNKPMLNLSIYTNLDSQVSIDRKKISLGSEVSLICCLVFTCIEDDFLCCLVSL